MAAAPYCLGKPSAEAVGRKVAEQSTPSLLQTPALCSRIFSLPFLVGLVRWDPAVPEEQ